jgi:hypothetical protein
MQNPQFSLNEFPKDTEFKMPNENGELTPLVKRSQKMEINHYWATQRAKVGLVLLFSALFLIAVLLQESGLFENLWSGAINSIWKFLLGLVGLK